VIVRAGDIRRTGHCVAGIKDWCAANGIDFRTLVVDGVPIEALEATGDALAASVCQQLRAQDGQE
jgi:hypothetical protein